MLYKCGQDFSDILYISIQGSYIFVRRIEYISNDFIVCNWFGVSFCGFKYLHIVTYSDKTKFPYREKLFWWIWMKKCLFHFKLRMSFSLHLGVISQCAVGREGREGRRGRSLGWRPRLASSRLPSGTPRPARTSYPRLPARRPALAACRSSPASGWISSPSAGCRCRPGCRWRQRCPCRTPRRGPWSRWAAPPPRWGWRSSRWRWWWRGWCRPPGRHWGASGVAASRFARGTSRSRAQVLQNISFIFFRSGQIFNCMCTLHYCIFCGFRYSSVNYNYSSEDY